MTTPRSRAALYLRVSTNRQTVENQRPDLERLAATRGYDIVAVFEETESAVKKRPAYEAALKAAHRGEYDALLVWSLSRFGRSMVNNMNDVLSLDRCGVAIISHSESWLDMSKDSPVRGLLIGIFSWVAEVERTELIKRTRAGLERARAAGKQIGRRKRFIDLEHAQRLRAEGLGLRATAKRLGVGVATLQRALKRDPKPSPNSPTVD